MARAPQRRRSALIEKPTHGEVDDPLAVTSPSKFIEAPNCSQILRVAWRTEFRVGQAQIVSLKLRVFPQLAGQQTAAQCTVGQGCQARLPAIGQELLLDLALEQIVGRLHDVQLGDAAKALDLGNREIADADSPDLASI